MKVAKFGGSSLATANQIKKVCKIITSDPKRRLIVVSAPGKACDEDIKVTDLLIACAEKYISDGFADKEFDAVIARYSEIIDGLGLPQSQLDEIIYDIKQRLTLDTSNEKRFLDAMKAAGEDNCAKIVASYLCSIGIDAHYIDPKESGLLLSDEYGNARLLPESYENLKKLRNIQGVMIFPGFFGYTPNGELVTFSRGGSDITGSILAAALNAELYENFTDVDSVFAANPKVVNNPQPITHITYHEMRELAYTGFSILHEETLIPVFEAGVPICIKNTNNPSAPGTMISHERSISNGPVVGIAGDNGFCSIYVSKFMMNREIGFGRKLLQILEEDGLSYEHIPSGIDNISIILDQSQFKPGMEERIVKRIKTELHVDSIHVEHNLSLIIIVGKGMSNTVGIAARATGAIAKAGINILMINQGSSEISMLFAVNANDETNAIKALYDEFFYN